MGSRNHSEVTEFILLGFSTDANTQNVLFIVFMVSYLTLLAVNGLLIFAVTYERNLHNPMYLFLVNLSLIHISSSTAFVPKLLVIFSSGERRISFTGCIAQAFLDLLGGSECINLLFMAYDRYIAICKPLQYNMIMSISACIWMIAVTWTVSSLMSSINIFLLRSFTFCGSNIINHYFCSYPSLIRLTCSDTTVLDILALIETATILLVPLLLIILSYYKIIASIKKILSGRYKAFSSCLSHLIIVTMFYVLIMVVYTKQEGSAGDTRDKIASVFYIIIAPILNPIIYCLKNEDVLVALKKIWRLQWSLVTMSYMMTNHNVQGWQRSKGVLSFTPDNTENNAEFIMMLRMQKSNNGTQ